MEQYEIYLDLDGVMADFIKKANQVLGYDFFEADKHGNTAWEELRQKCPRIYRELEMMEDASELLSFIRDHKKVKGLSVLTAIPRRIHFECAIPDKTEWCVKNLGYIPVKFGPYSQDKQHHCKGKNHILIDDNRLNIEQWIIKGGIGILHYDVESTIEELKALGF